MNRKKITGYFLLAALEALLGSIYLLAIPSDPKNQWLWGYSLSRMILFAGFLLVFIISFWLVHRSWRNTDWVEGFSKKIFTSDQNRIRLLHLASLGLFLTSTILLIPPDRFGIWKNYLERVLPFVWYLALLCLQTTVILIYQEKGLHWGNFSNRIKEHRSTLLPSALTFAGLLSLWGGITLTGIGVRGNWGLWREAGVPILPSQIWTILAILAIWQILIRSIYKQGDNPTAPFWRWLLQHKLAILSFGIWLLTFLLWATPPIQRDFFFPGPYPPDDAFYPFADSASWDVYGQFALIGEGFANGNAFADHSGLAGFEAILHLLIGQNYSALVVLQILLYAIFPVILYRLGRSFHSSSVGIFLAGLGIFRELNAFASGDMINLSHAKHLLTEFPVGLGLAAISLMLFLWFRKEPHKNTAYILPIGAVLGILILLRFNTLILPFAVFAGILLVYWRNWKDAFKATLLMVLAILIVLSPWMWRSWKIAGTPFFFSGVPSAILNENFRAPPAPEPTLEPLSSFDPIPEANKVLSVKYSVNKNITIKRKDSAIENLPKLKNHLAPGGVLAAGDGDESTFASSLIEENPPTVPLTVLNHFAHNLVTSVLILPTNPLFHDLKDTIYEASPYWNKFEQPWTGNLPLLAGLGLFINLGLISLGIGTSWKKWRLAGLVPLGIYLVYNFSTALARTSGGRYIVPIGWVVLFYFSLGLIQLVCWGSAFFGLNLKSKEYPPAQKVLAYKKGFLVLLPFLLFVSAMTIIDQSTPQRYPELGKFEVYEKLLSENLLAETDISYQELNLFLEDAEARAYFGRNLFPRYYEIGKGEDTAQKTAYSREDYPRVGFTFIGPFGVGQAVLPLSQPPLYFPHAEDIIVIGCKRKGWTHAITFSLDALMVIFPGEDETLVYTRDPMAPLHCPLSEPVCDEDRNCK